VVGEEHSIIPCEWHKSVDTKAYGVPPRRIEILRHILSDL